MFCQKLSELTHCYAFQSTMRYLDDRFQSFIISFGRRGSNVSVVRLTLNLQLTPPSSSKSHYLLRLPLRPSANRSGRPPPAAYWTTIIIIVSCTSARVNVIGNGYNIVKHNFVLSLETSGARVLETSFERDINNNVRARSVRARADDGQTKTYVIIRTAVNAPLGRSTAPVERKTFPNGNAATTCVYVFSIRSLTAAVS